jgi:hypothetical protein
VIGFQKRPPSSLQGRGFHCSKGRLYFLFEPGAFHFPAEFALPLFVRLLRMS